MSSIFDKKRIDAYYIHKKMLPLATDLMNVECSGSVIFKSRVIKIIDFDQELEKE